MFIPPEIIRELRSLNCEEVAIRFGMEVKHHMTRCFKHNDNVASLGFKNSHWKCFACDASGDSIELVRELFSLSFIDACTLLCEEYHIHIQRPANQKRNIRRFVVPARNYNSDTQITNPFDNEVADFILANSELTESGMKFLIGERNLSLDIVKVQNIHSVDTTEPLKSRLIARFGIKRLIDAKILGEDGRRFAINTPSILIPYYDEYSNLIGLQSRFLGPQNPSFPIARFKRLCNSQNRLYNLKIVASIDAASTIYISEGITDCLALLSQGKQAVAIPSASSLPFNDLQKLKNYRLTMVPDNDAAGSEALFRLYRFMLRHGCIVRKYSLPDEFKDYSAYYRSLLSK